MQTEHEQTPEGQIPKIDYDAEYKLSFYELLKAATKKTRVRIASIECGSKKTELFLFKDGTFFTFIRNTSKQKTPNETTLSYTAVLKIMQDYVNRENQPIMYRDVTKNSAMRNFAQSIGPGISSTITEYAGEDPEQQFFEVEIKPDQE